MNLTIGRLRRPLAGERQRYADSMRSLDMRRFFALIGIAMLGCATQSTEDWAREEHPKSIPVIGRPGDFKTLPGQYEGYDVVQCWDRSCGGIVGTGRNWPPTRSCSISRLIRPPPPRR
jgi:hypothetical protein